MNAKRLIFVAFASVILSGCAGIEPPNPDDVVRHPFGTEAVKVGMTKNEVESLWGKPDEISIVEDKEKWKGPREVWTYRAQASAIPVDAGYLSRTKKLYFDGDNLTNIGEGQ
ncbi:MAG: hypothetical protein HZC19_01925 [Candidatus Omnitrophica bacterium]|nr:hypothetical protein [Candidatus Omnitrophota bacterium]